MTETAGLHRRDGELYFDTLPLAGLAAQYGTPAYLYSARVMRAQARTLQAAFAVALPPERQPLLAFACKANSNLAVLRLFAGLGLGADIVSGGELARALAAGVPMQRVVFSGVGKSDDEIRQALHNSVRQLNVESKSEMERIATLAAESGRTAPVSIRVNPDVDAKTHDKISTGREEDKFGLNAKDALALYAWASRQPSLQPRGFSMHIGSQLLDISPFGDAFRRLADLVREARKRGLTVTALDIGGGIGVPYRDETPPDVGAYARLVADIIAPLDTDIVLEPGRYLVAAAGVLLARVLHVKNGAANHLILDAGMNDLIRPALYDAWHPIEPVTLREGDRILYDIVGPVCETSDRFATGRKLPPMAAGDLVAIGMAGAYGFTMASVYNSRPLPPEIMVDGARSAIVRPRQTVADLYSGETMPDWLGEAP